MNMFDFAGRMGEMKKMMDEIHSRLDQVSVKGESPGRKVTVIMNGNSRVTSVSIHDSLVHPENREELEELIEIAVNHAGEQARKVSESEMRAAGSQLLPGFPGLF